MSDINDLSDLAVTLASRLKKQTDKWVDAFYHEHYKAQQIQDHFNLSIKTVIPIVTAFQIVHIMSFIHVKKYIKESQMGYFINVLNRSLHDSSYDDYMKYIEVYQSNKRLDFTEQLGKFCEDVSMALTGSYAGMLYGPAFIGMAREFLYRSWGIAADHFGDRITMEEFINIVKVIHNIKKT